MTADLTCALCGKNPATGFATIDDRRYCHGDYEPDPTCYMRAQRLLASLPNAIDAQGEPPFR